jgi:hypothetical protein
MGDGTKIKRRARYPFLPWAEIEPEALRTIGRADLLRWPAVQRAEKALRWPARAKPKPQQATRRRKAGARILPDLSTSF